MNLFIRYWSKVSESWMETLRNSPSRNRFIFTIVSYFFMFRVFRVAMAEFETRSGTPLNDYLLAHLPAIDSSLIIFSLTYSALIIFIVTSLTNSRRFMMGIQAYTLLLVMRMMTIYLVPLEPPRNMIVLVDPISNFFMPSVGGGYIVRDLFFSGHVSAITLFYFVSKNKWVKRVLLSFAIIIASLILLQHVHYLIDVVAAPFFSFWAFRIVRVANKETRSFIPIPSRIFRRKPNDQP